MIDQIKQPEERAYYIEINTAVQNRTELKIESPFSGH
jgi:hypothetical protein